MTISGGFGFEVTGVIDGVAGPNLSAKADITEKVEANLGTGLNPNPPDMLKLSETANFTVSAKVVAAPLGHVIGDIASTNLFTYQQTLLEKNFRTGNIGLGIQ